VIREALKYVPRDRLYPCTNCGMVPLSRDVARGKLEALGAGAALVRAELAS
jgi:5-methyltetrahydropteroyltriglutamate--homocysteine methyltransferase